MRALWWRENGVFVVGSLLGALLTTGACLVIDIFEPGAPLPFVYWAFAAAGVLPVAYGAWHLRKLPLWFGFGAWLGLICLLPLIPWYPAKRFFTAARGLAVGMSLREVRGTMRGYREEPEFATATTDRLVIESPDKEAIEEGKLVWVTHFRFDKSPILESVSYHWDPDGSNDAVTVYLDNDRVTSIQISTE